MTNAASDAETRVKSLIDITTALGDILLRENELLENQRAREIAPLQTEKVRLAAAYAQAIRDVAQNRALVSNADSILLQELREITKLFEERAANQRALLKGASMAAEGIVKAVAAEASAANECAAYGGNAPRETASAPISIDESA